MSDSPNKQPQKQDEQAEQDFLDPQGLAEREDYNKNPREVVENPAVAPQMLNDPGDLRDDLMDEP